jgi:hypothetical protein
MTDLVIADLNKKVEVGAEVELSGAGRHPAWVQVEELKRCAVETIQSEKPQVLESSATARGAVRWIQLTTSSCTM